MLIFSLVVTVGWWAEVARLLLDPRRRARAAALPPGSLLREFWVEREHLPDSAWARCALHC